jgi:hypothetical protein
MRETSSATAASLAKDAGAGTENDTELKRRGRTCMNEAGWRATKECEFRRSAAIADRPSWNSRRAAHRANSPRGRRSAATGKRANFSRLHWKLVMFRGSVNLELGPNQAFAAILLWGWQGQTYDEMDT